MTALLLQEASFRAVSPAALTGYVRSLNWVKDRPYRDVSDVYIGEGLPDIIVPRTQRIADYGFVVGRLIEDFSEVSEMDPQAVYQDLVNADRDVIRVSVPVVDEESLLVEEGVGLVTGSRDMLLASACSFDERRSVYRAGANQAAMEYLRRVRLGHTEHGSFAVTLLPPVVPPEVGIPADENDEYIGRLGLGEPLDRRMTGHFSDTLSATRMATEGVSSGTRDAFARAVASGVSANLCDAVAGLIGSFPKLEVSVSWALTRPVAHRRSAVSFFQDDSPVLRAASESFRSQGPKHDIRIFGKVGRLARDEGEVDGRITIRASVEGRTQSVNAVLRLADYENAISAHQGDVVLGLEGDLERVGRRWHLQNPRVVDVISLYPPDWEDDEEPDGGP